MKFLDNKEDDSQWLPISDLMTVLMAIFLIISIIYLNERLSPAQKYIKTKADIYNDLEKTFKDNNWKGYEIDKQDLSIKFVESLKPDETLAIEQTNIDTMFNAIDRWNCSVRRDISLMKSVIATDNSGRSTFIIMKI